MTFWDDLAEYDARALADLSPVQRRQQLLARWTLYTYIDDLREEAEWRGVASPVLADRDVLLPLRELGDYLATAVTLQELEPEELGQQPLSREEKSLTQR